MTRLEKYKIDHPEYHDTDEGIVDNICPDTYVACDDYRTCYACWDAEVEEDPDEPIKDKPITANKVHIHSLICNALTDLYERKNKDYGDSFGKSFKEYGMTMPCIRLEDKLSRLKSLTNPDNIQQVSDESIEDTLMDLANYAIMTLIELKEGK